MQVTMPTGTPSHQTIASHLASAQSRLVTDPQRAAYHANRAASLLNQQCAAARAGSAS